GETVRRTWQLAHAMKAWRSTEAGQGWPSPPSLPRPAGMTPGGADNERVLRYLAKHTAEPAIVHGVADEVGSLRPGRLADIVLWEPSRFGVQPALVLKAGHFAWGPLGEGNASVEGAEPVAYAPHWAATGRAAVSVATTFVSRAALDAGIRERLGSARRFVAAHGTRGVRGDTLLANRAAPPIEVDPADGTVRLDGRELRCEPVAEVPLNRRYLLG
ncbi:MAG: amidohydrolase family protein, partial [Actinomycetota bacterium]